LLFITKFIIAYVYSHECYVWRSWDRVSLYISIVKQTKYTIYRVYWISPYMFRTVFPSIIMSSRLYIQHQMYVIQVRWLYASGQEMENLVPASIQSTNLYDILMLYVRGTVFNSWGWRKDCLKHTEWYSVNSKNCASSWFYNRKNVILIHYERPEYIKSIISCIPFLHPIMCAHTGQLDRSFQVMF
jgi:hypothetical protein